MRRLTILFLFLPVFCSAQNSAGGGAFTRLTSEVIRTQRLLSDSSMQHEYNELFRMGYFYLDTGLSGLVTSGGIFYSWNDSVGNDSVAGTRFYYRFQYPGALSKTLLYKPLQVDGKLYPDTIPFCKPGSLLREEQLAAIVKRKLHVPLNECTVEPHIYRDCFGCDRKREVWSREGHPLLLIQHRRDVREKDGFVSKTVVRDFVIDACTGKTVGSRDRSVYRYVRGEN